MENALLRERINDIAAEVAKLAMQLEGPNSPIEAHAGGRSRPPPKPATRPANGAASNGAAAPLPEGGGTLAERIRALQSHASRARQQGAERPNPASPPNCDTDGKVFRLKRLKT